MNKEINLGKGNVLVSRGWYTESDIAHQNKMLEQQQLDKPSMKELDKNAKEDALMDYHNIKGVRAMGYNSWCNNGERIYSGQVLKLAYGNTAAVTFKPNFGFQVGNTNLADTYAESVHTDVSRWDKIKGSLMLFYFNLFGMR